MTQLADLIVVDGSAANQTFFVQNVDYTTGVASWATTAASFDAARVISFSLRPPSKTSNRVRIRAKVVIPIMDPVLTTKKIDELVGEISFSIPKTAASLARGDLRAFVRNFLSDNVVINAVNTFQGVY